MPLKPTRVCFQHNIPVSPKQTPRAKVKVFMKITQLMRTELELHLMKSDWRGAFSRSIDFGVKKIRPEF